MESQSSSSPTILPSSPGPGSAPDSEAPERLAVRNPHTGAVVSKIEDIIKDMLDALRDNRILSIPLRSRKSGNERMVRFPATTDVEVKRFTCLLQILHLSHECLVSGTIITKRNIYYQNPDLFGSLSYIDTLVSDIAFTFGVGRDALNIVAACKGLISGMISISMKDGSVQNCSLDQNGTLIPDGRAIEYIDASMARWVLIVEKEATFRGLSTSRYFEASSAGSGILISGKGYPDLATRQFLNLLQTAFPQLPIYALVDFDPDGLAIMCTYKFGSLGLSHEENITLPNLSWLGPMSHDFLDRTPSLYSADLSQPGKLPSSTASSNQEYSSWHQNVQSSPSSPVNVSSGLTAIDRKKGTRLLEKLADQLNRDSSEDSLIYELRIMLMLNIKAEIQAIDDAGDITVWLDQKLAGNLSR
ncbi:Spo11/DNA topoisomerase VI subunit A [Biscogniauxia marginata]|nr:Spo11/DNA topoisomerase VI subunit A [Biscogniauxia marginata]